MLSSVTSLLATLRWAHANAVDYHALAREQADYYHRILNRLTAFRRDGLVDPASVHDVHYARSSRTRSQPFVTSTRTSTCRSTPSIQEQIAGRLAAKPKGRLGGHDSVGRPRPRPRGGARPLRRLPELLQRALGGRVTRDIDHLVAELTLDEKASLTAGADLWTIAAVERLGVPAVAVTDGPNGARGTTLPGLGASTRRRASRAAPRSARRGTRTLVERVGALLGDEAPAPRRAGCCWPPTVNIHRSPLGGPELRVLLRGSAAVGPARGRVRARRAGAGRRHHRQALRRQRRRVRAQHDQLGRSTSARCARSTWCPFELAVREGGALGIMTAYNRLNGPYCAEHERAAPRHPARRVGLRGLRDDRLVRGRASRSARRAPGSTSRCRARAGSSARRWPTRSARGEVDEALVDDAVPPPAAACSTASARSTTRPAREPRVGRPARAPGAAPGGGRPRRPCCCATSGRPSPVLPLDPPGRHRWRSIGPNADRAQIMGGGSAEPRAALPGHAARRVPRARSADRRRSATSRAATPTATSAPLESAQRRRRPTASPGLGVELFAGHELAASKPVRRSRVATGGILCFGDPAPGVDGLARPRSRSGWPGASPPTRAGATSFTLAQVGSGPVVRRRRAGPRRDDRTRRRPASRSSGSGSAEVRRDARPGGRPARSRSWSSASSRGPAVLRGVQVGARRSRRADLLDRAVAAAAAAPTRWSWSSAPTTSGSPRATTASRWTCPAARTS